MAQIKGPKGSPSIDMTPMVDLAFLLVTFFMLAANFRSDDIPVDSPSSIASLEIPKNSVLISIDKGGRIFYGFTAGEQAKLALLKSMSAKYRVPFSPKQYKEFVKLSSFGCSMRQLPNYLDMAPEERKKVSGLSVPVEKTNNELKDWIIFSKREGSKAGEEKYLEAVAKDPEAKADDFKLRYILRVDGKTVYERAKMVIETFRDIKENNLNFITSLEAGREL